MLWLIGFKPFHLHHQSHSSCRATFKCPHSPCRSQASDYTISHHKKERTTVRASPSSNITEGCRHITRPFNDMKGLWNAFFCGFKGLKIRQMAYMCPLANVRTWGAFLSLPILWPFLWCLTGVLKEMYCILYGRRGTGGTRGRISVPRFSERWRLLSSPQISLEACCLEEPQINWPSSQANYRGAMMGKSTLW